jgi:hypothetical protein
MQPCPVCICVARWESVSTRDELTEARPPWRFLHPWPSADAPRWLIEMWFEVVDGQLVCVGLAMRSSVDESGIEVPTRRMTAGAWREIQVRALEDELRPPMVTHLAVLMAFGNDYARRDLEALGHQPNHEVVDGVGAWKIQTDIDETRSRLLEVARVYSKAWTLGIDDGNRQVRPVKAVQQRFGIAASTARKWIGEARNEARFLEPTQERRANGELTDLARSLLEEI